LERAQYIGQAARARVLADHTYTQRGALVHDILRDAISAKASEAVEVPV
jgi:lactam utilization protein B